MANEKFFGRLFICWRFVAPPLTSLHLLIFFQPNFADSSAVFPTIHSFESHFIQTLFWLLIMPEKKRKTPVPFRFHSMNLVQQPFWCCPNGRLNEAGNFYDWRKNWRLHSLRICTAWRILVRLAVFCFQCQIFVAKCWIFLVLFF